MIIQQYDVSLVRLKLEHIEELRYWRNSEKISSRMHYRQYITADMQQKWFDGINDIRTYLYMIIQFNGSNIGLAHGKDITTNNTEGGMFIWDDRFLQSHVPVVVSLFMSDLNFYFFSNTNTNCRILKTNKQVIAYNISLGFKLCEGQESNENQLYKLTREDYESNSSEIRGYLKNLFPNVDSDIVITLEEEDERNGVAAFIRKYYAHFDSTNSPVVFRLQDSGTHLI